MLYTARMATQSELQVLNEAFHTTNSCSLKKTATHPVFGTGNPNADIVFIGEAPGKKEDLEGVPFVGAAGKILNELLESIGMRREDIYITNTVKYRPPHNRDPLPEEKSACREWLYAELTAINPVLIVFLGRHALATFFPEEKISKIHGHILTRNISEIQTTLFLPLYHPAAALYNRNMRTTLFEDVKRISSIRTN